MRKTITKICVICFHAYQVEPHKLKHGRGTTCSRECSYELRAIKNRTRYTTTCQRCGIEFETTPSKQSKFCSKECHNPPHFRNCLHCGKEFRYSPSADALFCSRECCDNSEYKSQRTSEATKQAWQNETTRSRFMTGIKNRSTQENWLSSPHFQKGEKHPRYKGNRRARQVANSRYRYKHWRKSVLRRDNFTCQICKVRGGQLTAHHIKPWAEYPDLRYSIDNGLTLCHPCHIELHAR